MVLPASGNFKFNLGTLDEVSPNTWMASSATLSSEASVWASTTSVNFPSPLPCEVVLVQAAARPRKAPARGLWVPG